MNKNQKTKYFIQETISKPVTKKEFFRKNKEDVIGDCIRLSEIIKRKIFTKSEIDNLMSAGILEKVTYRSGIYFKKDDVSKGIKYLSEPPKLFYR